MATVFIAFIVLLLVVAALAIGVMMGRKPIGGSCGGIAATGVEGACSCGRSTPGSCSTPEEAGNEQKSVNYYDASQ